MEHFLGWAALLIVALVTFLLTRCRPAISTVLTVAFLIRAGAALFQFYVGGLPDSGSDAVSFERVAWQWAQEGGSIWEMFPGFNSYLISWVIGVMYALTGRSALMAQALSVGLGTGTVYLVYRLAAMLWNSSIAKKAAWVATFFPTLVLYSALTRREACICFFFLLGQLGVAYWASGKRKRGIVIAILGFVGATLFHGGMFVSLVAFSALLAFYSTKQLIIRLCKGFIAPVNIIVMLSTIALIGLFALGFYSVPKLGTMEQLQNTERILTRLNRSSRDTASYPAWLVPDSRPKMVILAPARTAYFLFSPFPWNVKSPKHLIGLADGLLYMVLTLLIWRNRKAIWKNNCSRMVFLVSIPVLLIFALAIGNFGTGTRHRSKMVGVAIVLAAPLIPGVVIKRSASRRIITEDPNEQGG